MVWGVKGTPWGCSALGWQARPELLKKTTRPPCTTIAAAAGACMMRSPTEPAERSHGTAATSEEINLHCQRGNTSAEQGPAHLRDLLQEWRQVFDWHGDNRRFVRARHALNLAEADGGWRMVVRSVLHLRQSGRPAQGQRAYGEKCAEEQTAHAHC
eukprot:scaffold7225_cov379-Prasinococcus_capsulatus_cf.AAC.11